MGVAGLPWGCWDGVSCGCGWKQSRGGITLRQRQAQSGALARLPGPGGRTEAELREEQS